MQFFGMLKLKKGFKNVLKNNKNLKIWNNTILKNWSFSILLYNMTTVIIYF